jgi:hypothetical protein
MSVKIVPYDALDEADLDLEAVYQGQAGGQLGGEAL